MVDLYASDEEKAEQLKQWWRANGRSLIVGLAIGLAAVFGWQAWERHRDNQAEQASALYSQLMVAMSADNSDTGLDLGKRIMTEYSGSTYAVLAALAVGKIRLDAGEIEGARDNLRWAMDNADDPTLVRLARLRLARLQLAQGNVDEALQLADSDPGAFEAAFAELQGDAYLVKGDVANARDAYTRALAQAAPGTPGETLLRMKLSDAGGAAGEGEGG